MGVKITGANQLIAKLNDIKKKEAVKQIVKLNTAEMQRKAQEFAPVDTGNLKRLIVLNLEEDGMTGTVSATAEYAPYVEYGTRFMDAQPFMKPAFVQQAQQFKSDLSKLGV